MATLATILALKIPRSKELDRLQYIELATTESIHIHTSVFKDNMRQLYIEKLPVLGTEKGAK